jgi:cytochrome c biogenesis protein CcmG/thiol:disulfide interchange protein DsbE
VIVVVGLATVWVSVAAGTDHAGRDDTITPGSTIAVNRPVPAVTGPLLGGRGTVSLTSPPGTVVVLNFWASWCHACRSEAATLDAVARSFTGRGVRFLGVDYEDRAGPGQAAARAFALPYPSVSDADGSIGDAFGVFGLPSTYLIGRDGRIRYMVVGRLDAASFRAALASLLSPSAAGSA